MSRIAAAFDALKKDGRGAFIPFLECGDPDAQTTIELAVEFAAHGATEVLARAITEAGNGVRPVTPIGRSCLSCHVFFAKNISG